MLVALQPSLLPFRMQQAALHTHQSLRRAATVRKAAAFPLLVLVQLLVQQRQTALGVSPLPWGPPLVLLLRLPLQLRLTLLLLAVWLLAA